MLFLYAPVGLAVGLENESTQRAQDDGANLLLRLHKPAAPFAVRLLDSQYEGGVTSCSLTCRLAVVSMIVRCSVALSAALQSSRQQPRGEDDLVFGIWYLVVFLPTLLPSRL